MALDTVKIWARYLILEEAFLEFEKYVPFSDEHAQITSPYLDDLLIRSCTSLESFFKSASHCKIFDNIEGQLALEKIRNNPKNASIKNIETIFNQYYTLSSKKVHHIYPIYKHVFMPFDNWNQENSPQWWIEYNGVKHNGFIKSATYENVRNSLGALFLAIVSHLEMINYLVSISIIHGHGFAQIAEYLIYNAPHYKIHPAGFKFSIDARSKLFGYIYSFIPTDDEQCFFEQIFSPPYDILGVYVNDNGRLIEKKIASERKKQENLNA